MTKKMELIHLYKGNDGSYLASLYNRVGGYFEERRFLYYAKREVIRKLRAEGVVCPHGTY